MKTKTRLYIYPPQSFYWFLKTKQNKQTKPQHQGESLKLQNSTTEKLSYWTYVIFVRVASEDSAIHFKIWPKCIRYYLFIHTGVLFSKLGNYNQYKKNISLKYKYLFVNIYTLVSLGLLVSHAVVQALKRQRQKNHLGQAWARETKTKKEMKEIQEEIRKRILWNTRGRQVFGNLRDF